MKIVFIRSNPVAPYPRLEKAANSLKKHGHDVHILAWDRSEDYYEKDSTKELLDYNVKITRFGIPAKYGSGFRTNLIPLLKFQFRVLKWLLSKRKSYDVIHAYDLDTGFVALGSSKLLGKKLVYDIADYYSDSHNLNGITRILIKKLENVIINKAETVIICTEQRKNQIQGTNPKNLEIVHNSPISIKKPTKTELKLPTSDGKLKLVYVGILGESRFIKQIAELVAQRDDCEFHVGGFGKLEKYFKKQSELRNNIFYYGKLSYDKTILLEMKCDVISAIYDPKVPNHYFAAPNKFYEALMLGKPIIMAKGTGMSEVVEHYNIGEVIDYTTESLNKTIDKLVDSRNNMEKVSNTAKKLYNDRYSWAIMEDRLFNIYNNL